MPASQSQSDPNLLIEVARLYYEQQLTQSEIGRQINVSRSTVSRLLQEARDLGIVTITIDYNVARDRSLEQQLQKWFDLKDVRVLRSYGRTNEVVRKEMGQLAARLLEQGVMDDSVLGISYGRSIAETVAQVNPSPRRNLTVIPIIGALGSDNPLIEGIDLARELASKFDAKYRYLHAPLMVEDPRTRELLLQEPSVQDVLAMGAKADCVIIGIGALQSRSSGLIWSGYVNRKELAWLQNIGAVGHTCAQFFDVDGNLLDIEINHRSISIGLETLRDISNVIAIAGTADKATAILGALHGGYIDILVTDDQAAEAVLALYLRRNSTDDVEET